jgi:hypothetical protein
VQKAARSAALRAERLTEKWESQKERTRAEWSADLMGKQSDLILVAQKVATMVASMDEKKAGY